MGRVKVFLSYRRADTQHVAGRVADRLDELFELFMDIDTIPPGVDFTDYVRQAVGGCDVLVAFIGDRWLSLTDDQGRRRIDDPADWVAEEISVALRRDVRVIPVLVDEARMPGPDELPPALRGLVNRQALPLRHATFSADLARLVAGIQHAAAASRPDPAPQTEQPAGFAGRWEPAAPAPPPPLDLPTRIPAGPPWRRRPWWIAVAAVVLLAAVVTGYLLTRPEGGGAAAPTDPAGPAGGPSPTPPPATPAADPPRTLAELRSRVPEPFRRTCRRFDPKPQALRAGLVLAAQCAPAQGDGVGPQPQYSYYLFYADPRAAEDAYLRYYAGSEVPSGDCTAGPGERAWSRDDLGGRLRCYPDADGFRVFAWTTEQLAAVSSAADPTLGYAELERWWRRAGPLR